MASLTGLLGKWPLIRQIREHADGTGLESNFNSGRTSASGTGEGAAGMGANAGAFAWSQPDVGGIVESRRILSGVLPMDILSWAGGVAHGSIGCIHVPTLE